MTGVSLCILSKSVKQFPVTDDKISNITNKTDILELSGLDSADLCTVLQTALTENKVSLPGLFPWQPTATTIL